jgi:hypothetical protein
MPFTDTDITNAYDKTSQEMQDLIWAPETEKFVRAIASQNGLQSEQVDVLGDEMLYLLIGLTTKEEMSKRIQSLLQIPSGVADKMTMEFSSKLLSGQVPSNPQPTPAPSLQPQQSTSRTISSSRPVTRAPLSSETLPEADSSVRERLELRPEVAQQETRSEEESSAKPLTREDVLSALSPKRTMESDIASVKGPEEKDPE